MAYQQPGGINSGGPAAGNEHHGPQGAEYTLQGAHCSLHKLARHEFDSRRPID